MNRSIFQLSILLGVCLAVQSACGAHTPDEKTIKEFKEYIAEKLPNLRLSDAQLDSIATLVDADGDGKVSDKEFGGRMVAVRAVMGAREAEGSKDQKPEADGKADAKPEESGDKPKAEKKAEKKAVKKTNKKVTVRKFELPHAEVLIVTSGELAAAWQEFADWKTKTGRPAKIVTTDDIDNDFTGDDIQQKIRLCCLKHIADSGTRFVILGGDSDGDAGLVPDRDTDHSECKMLQYDNIPTDLYYVSEKDWDANDDGIYGSFADDIDEVVYTNPDACLGRIPVRTAADVKAYTDKVIAYESKYPVGQFANRMVYTCAEEMAYLKLGTSTKQIGEQWPTGMVSKFYNDETPWDDQAKGDYDLTPDNWAKMINQRGAAKIHMHGHGLLPVWILENNTMLSRSTVSKLKNKNAYPIITTVSCLTGQYDDRNDPSVSESMIRQPNGGAIAVLAPSREGVPFMLDPRKDFPLMVTEGKMDGTTTAYTKFWISALKDRMTIGEAFKQVKMDMASMARGNDGYHLLQCELNLLGDPTLDPRPEPPSHFNGRLVVHEGKITAFGFKGATLCVWNGADHYEVVKAKSNITSFDVKKESGPYSVSAFGPGFNTWVEEGVEGK